MENIKTIFKTGIILFSDLGCFPMSLVSVQKLFATRQSEGQLYPPLQNDNGAASKFKAQTGVLQL